MKLCAYYVVRAAGAQSFAPLEKARVSCGGLTASHRDGGFYVFLSPLPANAEITVSCQGHSSAAIKAARSGRSTVYLMQSGVPPLGLSFITSSPADSGAQEIFAVPTDFSPQVLDGCILDYGSGRAEIARYDRISSKIQLSEPLKKALPRGTTLTVSTEQE